MEKTSWNPVGNSSENCDDNFEAVLKIVLKTRKTLKYSRNKKKYEID